MNQGQVSTCMKKNRFSIGSLITGKSKFGRPKIILQRNPRVLDSHWKYTVLDLSSLRTMVLSAEYVHKSYELVK